MTSSDESDVDEITDYSSESDWDDNPIHRKNIFTSANESESVVPRMDAQSPQFCPWAYVPPMCHPPPPSPTPMPELVPIRTTTVEETDNVRPLTLSERLRRPTSGYVPPGYREEDLQAAQQEEATNSQPSTKESEE